MSTTNSAVSSLLSNLGSGIDTTTLISGLVAASSAPITALQSKQSQLASASQTISAFSNDLAALKTAATALATPSGFSAYSATSNDSSIVPTTTTGAQAGQYQVTVQQVAQQQVTYSASQDSNTDPLGLSGVLSISVGSGASVPITVNQGDSLNTIASAISSSGLGINASVVYDGSKYHLLIQGQSTGSANAVTIGDGVGLGFVTPQKAQDAQVLIGNTTDPSNPPLQFTSSTNQFQNAIPGVTFAVTKPTTSAATISVATNPSALTQQVQAFVTAYNQMVNDGHTDTGYGTTAASNSLLAADPTIRGALNQISQLVASPVAGTSGAYTSLASVGISLQNDGTLALNQATFSQAITTNPSAVQKLFVTDANTGATGIMQTIGATVDNLTSNSNSPVVVRLNQFTTEEANAASDLQDAQTRLTAYQTQLQAEFTQMNLVVSQYKAQFNQISQAFNTSSSSSSSSSSGSSGSFL